MIFLQQQTSYVYVHHFMTKIIGNGEVKKNPTFKFNIIKHFRFESFLLMETILLISVSFSSFAHNKVSHFFLYSSRCFFALQFLFAKILFIRHRFIDREKLCVFYIRFSKTKSIRENL